MTLTLECTLGLKVRLFSDRFLRWVQILSRKSCRLNTPHRTAVRVQILSRLNSPHRTAVRTRNVITLWNSGNEKGTRFNESDRPITDKRDKVTRDTAVPHSHELLQPITWRLPSPLTPRTCFGGPIQLYIFMYVYHVVQGVKKRFGWLYVFGFNIQ